MNLDAGSLLTKILVALLRSKSKSSIKSVRKLTNSPLDFLDFNRSDGSDLLPLLQVLEFVPNTARSRGNRVGCLSVWK